MNLPHEPPNHYVRLLLHFDDGGTIGGSNGGVTGRLNADLSTREKREDLMCDCDLRDSEALAGMIIFMVMASTFTEGSPAWTSADAWHVRIAAVRTGSDNGAMAIAIYESYRCSSSDFLPSS